MLSKFQRARGRLNTIGDKMLHRKRSGPGRGMNGRAGNGIPPVLDVEIDRSRIDPDMLAAVEEVSSEETDIYEEPVSPKHWV